MLMAGFWADEIAGGNTDMEALFYDKDNQGYTVEDIYHSLREIGAHDCDALFLHSDIMFGRISGDFKRKKYLAALTEVIERLKVKYLIVPTFTYSFCNQEDFDVSNSRTSMGALNEYLRKLPGRYRTHDPLLSLSIPEELKERFVNLSEFSLGGCGLDRIHHMDGVKFLFWSFHEYLFYLCSLCGKNDGSSLSV